MGLISTIVGLMNTSRTPINPATEEKQDAIIVLLTTLNSLVGSIGGGATGLTSGRKVVAVTNTALIIGTASAKTVFITALVGNTEPIVVGGASVIYTEASRTGKILYPGDYITVSVDNLNDIYINGVANDGVSFSYTT